MERPPSYRPSKDARGKDTISGIDPFVMQADGKGWIFVPAGLQDGPLPTHYEPQESVDEESAVRAAVQSLADGVAAQRQSVSPGLTTIRASRMCDHLSTDRAPHGRRHEPWLSWLSELQPEMFCEVSPELARSAV